MPIVSLPHGLARTAAQSHGGRRAMPVPDMASTTFDRSVSDQGEEGLRTPQAGRRVGLRADQGGARLHTVSTPRPRQGPRRVGAGMHRSQSRQALRGLRAAIDRARAISERPLRAMIGPDGERELLLGCLDALVRALCRPWRLWLFYQPNAPAARERSDRVAGGFGYSRRHSLLCATGS